MILIYARSYLLSDVVAPGAMPEVAVVALDWRTEGCGGGMTGEATIGGGFGGVAVAAAVCVAEP